MIYHGVKNAISALSFEVLFNKSLTSERLEYWGIGAVLLLLHSSQAAHFLSSDRFADILLTDLWRIRKDLF